MKSDNSEALISEALIAEYLPLVRPLAARMKQRVPAAVDIDDLEGAGQMGLIRVARTYAGQARSFRAVAILAIRGAMLDSLNRRDWREAGHSALLPDQQVGDLRGDPEAAAGAASELREARRMVEGLPPLERRVLQLRIGGGMTQAAAAERLGISRYALSRAERISVGRMREQIRRTPVSKDALRAACA